MWLLEWLVRNAWAQQAAEEPRVQSALRTYVDSPAFLVDMVLFVAIIAAFKLFALWPKYERWLVAAALLAFAFYAPFVFRSEYGGSFTAYLKETPWFFWMLPILLLALWLFLKAYTRWLEPPAAAAPAARPRPAQRAAPTPTPAADPAPVPPVQAPAPSPRPAAASAARDGVFLSYRRDDSADVTGRIYDRLVQRFGKAQVFKDVDSIPLGVDFREHLGDVVGRCSVVLVVIGDRWLNAGAPGARRLDDVADFVRIEIESALERRIPVVPVLVRGAAIPGDTDLPQTLRPLAYRNGIAVRPDPDFHRDMDRLITGLESHLGR